MTKIDEWVKTCLHKARFNKELYADIKIANIKRESGKVLYKYYCPHCFGWHLTKRER